MQANIRSKLFAAIACAAASSCAANRTSPEVNESAPEIDTVWGYLENRYDGNGDGQVTFLEYARDEDQFAFWDQDGDGALSAADFDSGGGGSESGPFGRVTMGMSRRMFSRYFQSDDDPIFLPLTEASEAFANYDGSDGSAADGNLTRGEFTAVMESRFQAVPGDELGMVQRALAELEPWSAILAHVDGDENGELTIPELVFFYTDVMETDTIDYSDWSAPQPQAGADSGGDDLAAQAGELAPNFTLISPDGETTYTLADFRHDQPVALIFGSYT